MFARQQFDVQIQGYLRGAQDKINKQFAEQFVNLIPDKLSIDPKGKRYIKIVAATNGGVGYRVFAFIDTTNGDILKPASWKAPAKHARGNVFDDDFGLSRTSSYGPEYLK